MEIMIEGINYLKEIDEAMYLQLTFDRWYYCCYYKKWRQNQEFFTISDEYLAWGKEGVVLGFVKAVFDFNLIESPMRRRLIRKNSELWTARLQVLNQLNSLLERHSFQPGLVRQYREGAEQLEQWLARLKAKN